VALSAAFFVNAAILVLAAAVFHKGGTIVTESSKLPTFSSRAWRIAATAFS